MRFVALEKLINMHDGYRGRFRVGFSDLLLIQQAGERYLLEAVCPHREHPLEVADISDGVVECPLHGYRFAITNGDLLHASEEPCRGLKVWPVEYEGNALGVLWEE